MQSTVQLKKWGDLTGEEETQKLLKLNDLLKKHGLEKIDALSTDHLCYMLKSNFSSKQSKIVDRSLLLSSTLLQLKTS